VINDGTPTASKISGAYRDFPRSIKRNATTFFQAAMGGNLLLEAETHIYTGATNRQSLV
jgi:hypothetical protein